MAEKDIVLRQRLVEFYNEQRAALEARKARLASIEGVLAVQGQILPADSTRFETERAEDAGREHVLGGLLAILATEDISPSDIIGE